MQEQIIDDLNDLLKGTNLAHALFEDYLSKVDDKKLKAVLNDCVKTMHAQKSALELHIKFLKGTIDENLGMAMSFAKFIDKLKSMMVADDKDIKGQVKDGLDMGVKACDEFFEKHHELSSLTTQIVTNIKADYGHLEKLLCDLESCGNESCNCK